MNKIIVFSLAISLIGLLTQSSLAQLKGQGIEIGIAGGVAQGQSEGSDHNLELNGRAFLGIPLLDFLGVDIGGGMTRNSNDFYDTELFPVDLRLRLGWPNASLTPYVYGGVGGLYYNIKTAPISLATDYVPADDDNAWVAFFPVGAGVQLRLSPSFALDLSGGMNFANTEFINPTYETTLGSKDGYLEVLLGLRFAPWSKPSDSDGDGLLNKDEKTGGTDPKNPDTDGDGLDDYSEVMTYKTSPLNADTDGDGLDDYNEVNVHRTNPLVADTDGDKLSDGQEVNTYRTNPNNADTDNDDLNDFSEVRTFKTDPLKGDTDGDSLTDGNEVMKHKTDPLKSDTDAGTIHDGIEVDRGTDPLDSSDDLPKKAVLKMEKGKAIILEGIIFKTASAEILPASEEILVKAYNTLVENPDIHVEIQGYTDNVGKREYNLKLSQKRAEAVKQWMVSKGIAADRLSTKGLGPDNPVADNSTPEGRQQNRRIEFIRRLRGSWRSTRRSSP